MAELYDRVEKTAKIRFNADRRLERHSQLSIWTTVLTSVALITISIWDALKLTALQPPALVDAIQILCSVFILAYSLILSMREYGVKAAEMHRCGLELSALKSEIQPFLGKAIDSPAYAGFSKRFDSIVSHYSNHEDIDYQQARLQMSYYKKKLSWFERALDHVRYARKYGHEFFHYYVVIILQCYLAWIVVGGNG